SINSFFSQYGQALAEGDLEPGEALKLFVIELAEGGLSDTIMESILSTEMIALRDGVRNGATGGALQDLIDDVTEEDTDLSSI
ncbi:MAG TPA: hypothetical protein VEB42_05600, partial [Chitinophagaceae bacterium]|nr:hypothetical protein [Chitinophagaceae bacterium]